MAKKSQVARESKRTKLVEQYKVRRDLLRTQQVNLNLTPEERLVAQIKLNKLPRDSSPSRRTYRCQITGRSRGGYRKFQLSRIKFREMALFGLIPGVTKASW